MAYAQQAVLKGSSQVYGLSANIKRYTLRDVGFIESKGGKFQLERSLDPNSPFNKSIKFKMVIEPDMKKFKMVVTAPNGLKEVDVYNVPNCEGYVEQLNYLLDLLIEREVIVKL